MISGVNQLTYLLQGVVEFILEEHLGPGERGGEGGGEGGEERERERERER